MSTRNLLYKHEVAINDHISIVIPDVGNVVDDEDNYYHLLYVLTAMPIDMMVVLDDSGIDFTLIDDYQLFLIMFKAIKEQDTSMFFKGIDLSDLQIKQSEQNGGLVLADADGNTKIDRAIHGKIADTLRAIHQLKRNNRMPANQEAKEFMIMRARNKLKKKRQSGSSHSQLEALIVALVNTEQYKYDFEGTRNLSIYQFNESVRQIIKKIDYDNRMFGVYTGNISAKDLNQDDLNWMSHK